jgi:hydrogenase nickel incorporation protein HypB
MKIQILEGILTANQKVAAENRAILDGHGVYCVNLMASPGAGKTTFILAMARLLKNRVRIGVVEADLASSVDADKVAAAGLPVLQINTDGGCHLNAGQLTPALKKLPLADIDLLIIENVGNLVCTAAYDLGEHLKLVLASVPEGDDKPYKYPNMFNVAQAVVVTKTDLIPYIPFSSAAFETALRGINPEAPLFELSAATEDGLSNWCDWLVRVVKAGELHGA